MTDRALSLLELPQLRHELAQIGARAALTELEIESTIQWRYRSERVARNLTAIGHALHAQVLNDSTASELRATALTVAQGWEHLATLGERVQSTTALLNSALFYEIAGYQANAACMARLATRPSRWSSEPSFDGLLSAFLQRLFLRVRALQADLTKFPSEELAPTEDDLSRRASQAVTSIALSNAALFFLSGDDSLVELSLEQLALAKEGFASAGDAVAYNAIVGIEHALPLMVDRSTWHQLSEIVDAPRWRRYLRVLARGLNSDILEGRSISELWPSQRAAVDGGVLDADRSLAIRMPTSAGKTRVAELAIVHTLVTRPGSKCVYIAPYRALANEIEESFTNLFHDLGYGASTVPGGYDQDEMGESIASTGDVLVLTPEKLDLLIRLRGELLDQVALIVIDEGHIVADRERGPKFELLVSRLRRRIPNARFLMMSAVVPDETLRDFALWLGGETGEMVSTRWRPSILNYGYLDWDGRRGTLRFANDDVVEGGLEFIPNLVVQAEYRHVAEETGHVRRPKFPRTGNKGDVAAEVSYRFAPLGPVLVFSMQTNWAESIASALLRRIELAELTDEPIDRVFALRREGRALAVAAEWLGSDHLVTQLLGRGIAFHHGRLPEAVRNAIEEDFRARRLSVLVATTTLAQGVNLPVRTVVVHSCRSREADGSPRLLNAREYWNIAGRAGRAGSETEGTVIHIASSPYDVEDFHRYASQRDDVERVESALHRMLADLVDQRITSDEAAAQLDADLLALLVEEDEVALNDELLAETLTSSLFHIQAVKTQIPIDSLIEVMTTTARRIGTDIPDVETRRLYAGTGLSSRSCQTIAEHVSENADVVAALLSEGGMGDREELVDLIIDGLAEVREMEPRAALPIDTRVLLSLWLDGRPVRDIASQVQVEDAQDVTEYIEDAFSYRLPWGASSYLRIAADLTTVTTIGPLAANIAGMIKFGVPSPEGAWAMSAGVASRRAAIAVADEFLRTTPPRAVGDFRRWLGRLDPDSVAERLGLSGAELESTARAILRSQPNDFLSAFDHSDSVLPLRAVCRPLRSAVETGLVYELSIGDSLAVNRDRDSRLNRNAVILAVGDQRLGYLQADAARAIGPEIDAGLHVVASVVEVHIGEAKPTEVTVDVNPV